MKTKIILIVIAIAALANVGMAQNFIQLSLFPPAQIVPEDEGVTGLRLNIYGKNTSLQGLDFGFVHHLTEPSMGFQHGLVGYNESDFTGWQENFVSITKGNFTGLQGGALNKAKSAAGIQYGIINLAGSMEGIQFGIFNQAENMEGIQIGIINVIENNGFMPIFPIVNWSFK